MDPISVAVILLAAWGIMQRTPGIVGQLAAEWQAGRRGATTQAAENLRKKLDEAGAPVSSGRGSLGNFLGNLWSDFWHEKDAERQRGQDDGFGGQERGWWRRRMDDAADRYAARYRGTGPAGPDAGEFPDPEPPAAPLAVKEQPEPRAGQDDSGPRPGPEEGPDAAGSEQDLREPVRVESRLGEEPRPAKPAVPPSLGQGPPPASPAPPGSDPPPASPQAGGNHAPGGDSMPDGPIRVPSTTGPAMTARPVGAVAVLESPAHTTEGTNPMGTAVATNGVAITSMTTGAYEMLSINNRLHEAVNQFVNELTIMQNRLVRAGESTLGTVQLSSRSTVMGSMSQAVEAISALKAAARSCTGEVSPLVVATKREFEKRI